MFRMIERRQCSRDTMYVCRVLVTSLDPASEMSRYGHFLGNSGHTTQEHLQICLLLALFKQLGDAHDSSLRWVSTPLPGRFVEHWLRARSSWTTRFLVRML
jgi:hypothetical protein